MKSRIEHALLLLGLLQTIVSSQPEFIIGAEWLNNPSRPGNHAHVPSPADWVNIGALGLNWGTVTYLATDEISYANSALDGAESYGIKLMMNRYRLHPATLGRRWEYHPEYPGHYSSGSRTGDGDGYEDTYKPKRFPDDELNANWSWLARASEHLPGWLAIGVNRDQSDTYGGQYCLKVRMRIENAQPFPHEPVCDISAVRLSDNQTATVTIYADSFTGLGYQELSGPTFVKLQGAAYDYRVYWHGTVTCFLDYVILDDANADLTFSGYFDNQIESEVELFVDHDALGRFKVRDEVFAGEEWLSVGYVSQRIQSLVAAAGYPTKTASHYSVGYSISGAHFNREVSWTQNKEVLCDNYPITYGDVNRPDIPLPDDPDYQSEYQSRIQEDFVLALRQYIRRANQYQIPFWLAPQTHSWTGQLREPTVFELRQMVELALSYGAKGIYYFLYWTIPEGYGLVNVDGTPRRTIYSGTPYAGDKWATVQSINAKLVALGPTLTQLTWIGGKSWTESSSSTDGWSGIVSSVSTKSTSGVPDANPLVETGHLTLGNLDYVYVVNRRTDPGVWDEELAEWTREPDIRDIALSINKVTGTFEVTDKYTGNIWIVNGNNGPMTIRLNPGEGALLEIKSHTAWNSKTFQGTEVVRICQNATLAIPQNASIQNIWRLVAETGGTLVLGDNATLTFTSATNIYDEGAPKGALCISGKIEADGATLSPNNQNYYWAGIYVSNSDPSEDYNYLLNCTISGCKYGLTVYNSRFEGWGDEISGNTFTHCLNPIRLTYSTSVQELSQNTFLDNYEDGIVVYGSTLYNANNNVIDKSQFGSGARDGMWLYGSSVTPMLTNNTISHTSRDGIRCESYAAPRLGGPDGTPSTPGENTITSNGRYGVNSPSTTQPFLGDYDYAEDCAIYGGWNTIDSNATKQLYVASAGQQVMAEWNWWGMAPDSPLDEWDFQYSTSLSLFGNTNARIRPAQQEEGMEALMCFEEEMESIEEAVDFEEEDIPIQLILLTLADQLAMNGKPELALSYYDTLIRQYPSSDEALASVLRAYHAIHSANTLRSKSEPVLAQIDVMSYLDDISKTSADERIIEAARELSADASYAALDLENAANKYEAMLRDYAGTETEKHALSILVDIYYRLGDGKRSKEALAELAKKYSDDPVTALTASVLESHRMSETAPSAAVATTSGFSAVRSIQPGKSPTKSATVEELKENRLSVYPNPFNPTTTISFTVKEPSHVKIEVFDVLGRRVTELADRYQATTSGTVEFNASTLPSGIYYVAMHVNGIRLVQRMVLLK